MESLWREKWSFEMPLRCSLPASSLRWQMLDIAVHRFLVPERLHSPTYRTEISREDALNIFRHPALSQTSNLYDFNIIWRSCEHTERFGDPLNPKQEFTIWPASPSSSSRPLISPIRAPFRSASSSHPVQSAPIRRPTERALRFAAHSPLSI